MAVIYTDNFNRADGALTAPWTTATGVIEIVSNQVAGEVAAGGGQAYYNNTTPNDYYVKFTYGTGGSTTGGTIALIARWVSTNEYYLAEINQAGPSTTLYVRNFGFTSLGSIASAPSPGDVVELRVVGTTISYWLNGVQQISNTDATFASGFGGLYSNNGGQRQFLDDFELGDFSAAASQPEPNDVTRLIRQQWDIGWQAQRRPFQTPSLMNPNANGGGNTTRDPVIRQLLSAWDPPFVMPQQTRKFTTGFVAPVVNNPPPRRSAQQNIVSMWAVDWNAQRSPQGLAFQYVPPIAVIAKGGKWKRVRLSRSIR